MRVKLDQLWLKICLKSLNLLISISKYRLQIVRHLSLNLWFLNSCWHLLVSSYCWIFFLDVELRLKFLPFLPQFDQFAHNLLCHSQMQCHCLHWNGCTVNDFHTSQVVFSVSDWFWSYCVVMRRRKLMEMANGNLEVLRLVGSRNVLDWMDSMAMMVDWCGSLGVLWK